MPDFQFRSIDTGRYRRSISDPRADFRWRAELLEPLGPAPHRVPPEGALAPQSDQVSESQVSHLDAPRASQSTTQSEPADRTPSGGQ